MQRIRNIVGDAGFEPETSAPEVWCATNEPPHLQIVFTIHCSKAKLIKVIFVPTPEILLSFTRKEKVISILRVFGDVNDPVVQKGLRRARLLSSNRVFLN